MASNDLREDRLIIKSGKVFFLGLDPEAEA